MLIETRPRAAISDVQRGELAREIRRTIDGIIRTTFEVDPPVVPDASIAVSAISSAYKRHGIVLEKALLAALETRPDMKAWRGHIVIPTHRAQVDLLTYNDATLTPTVYELKRGFGKQDSDALRSLERRLTALKSELPEYAASQGIAPRQMCVAVIAYYGRLGSTIGPYRVIDASGLATEFDTDTAQFVCDVNDYYRHRFIAACGTALRRGTPADQQPFRLSPRHASLRRPRY